MNTKVIYEPHPVSPERKAELRAQGFKIIDKVFEPSASLREDGPTIAEYVAAGYLAANYPPEGFASRSSADEIAAAIATGQGAKPSDGLTVPELEAALVAKEIGIPAGAKKADLQALLDAAA